MKRFPIAIIVLFLVIPFSLCAQDTFSKTTSNLTFQNSSEKRFIETYVSEGSLSLHIKIDSEIKEGNLIVEIINKDDNKNYGSFSIGGSRPAEPTEKSSITEEVSSTIQKVINNPKPGFYRINIDARETDAILNVVLEQFYK